MWVEVSGAEDIVEAVAVNVARRFWMARSVDFWQRLKREHRGKRRTPHYKPKRRGGLHSGYMIAGLDYEIAKSVCVYIARLIDREPCVEVLGKCFVGTIFDDKASSALDEVGEDHLTFGNFAAEDNVGLVRIDFRDCEIADSISVDVSWAAYGVTETDFLIPGSREYGDPPVRLLLTEVQSLGQIRRAVDKDHSSHRGHIPGQVIAVPKKYVCYAVSGDISPLGNRVEVEVKNIRPLFRIARIENHAPLITKGKHIDITFENAVVELERVGKDALLFPSFNLDIKLTCFFNSGCTDSEGPGIGPFEDFRLLPAEIDLRFSVESPASNDDFELFTRSALVGGERETFEGPEEIHIPGDDVQSGLEIAFGPDGEESRLVGDKILQSIPVQISG